MFQRYSDLIDGGRGLHSRLDSYLVPSRADLFHRHRSPQSDLEEPFPAGGAPGATGPLSDWESKKRWAFFTPHAAGVFDFITASVDDDPPTLYVAKDDPVSDRADVDLARQPYWDDLEDRLQYLVRPTTRYLLQFGKAYLSLWTPPNAAANLRDARAVGALDTKIFLQDPASVIDWEYEGETLLWAKLAQKKSVRSVPFGPFDRVQETYTFCTASEIVGYSFTYPAKEPPDEKTLVAPVSNPHGFGAVPLIPVEIPDGLHAAQRLEDPILDLFNAEAGLSWWVNLLAHPMLTAPDPNNIPRQIPNSPTACVIGKLEFAAPNPGAFEALFRKVETSKANLFAVLQALAAQALVMQGQNARQSAQAKTLDLAPMTALIRTYANAIRHAFKQAIKPIQTLRKEDGLLVELQGLENVDGLSLNDKLAALLQVQNIPNYPQSALRWQTLDVACRLNPSMPQAYKKKLVDEIEAASAPKVEKEAGPPAPEMMNAEHETE